MMKANNLSLSARLAEVLPINTDFCFHHLSTPPSLSSSLFATPPGQTSEKTFCESHFLSISIVSQGRYIHIFAIEVLIYTTAHLTTVFISKADSTGYLYLLNLPRDTVSPLKSISSAFLAFLIEKRQRSDRKLVLSLFARAQDQYLFPGSIENRHKHVLDDRNLVKWWCQVVNHILLQYPESQERPKHRKIHFNGPYARYTAHGHLRVPGCDPYEIRSFFPKQTVETRGQHLSVNERWKPSDPLEALARFPDAPERYLIPYFPDDPKARFVDELNDENPEPSPNLQQNLLGTQRAEHWKSVKSLEQFWEMMAFRQECSSGRLVGFLWGVFSPIDESSNRLCKSRLWKASDVDSPSAARKHGKHAASVKSEDSQLLRTTPEVHSASSPSLFDPQPKQSSPLLQVDHLTPETKRDQTLAVPISAREPSISKIMPERTKYYYWPSSGRGEVVLRRKDYHRVSKLLLHLDYANVELAAQSTRRWIDDVSIIGRIKSWGFLVKGRRESQLHSNPPKSDIAMLSSGLLRKKKRSNQNVGDEVMQFNTSGLNPGINILSGSIVRKRTKVSQTSKKA